MNAESLITNGGFTPAAGGGAGDVTAPTITVVNSPTTAAGALVLEVTDAAPGLAYLGVFVTFQGDTAERVIYRRGVFKAPFITDSYITPIANGYRLNVYRAGGWPEGTHAYDVDAIDGDGNDEGA